MNRLKQTNGIIDTLKLGQSFTVKINGTSRTIKANMDWEGITLDRFFEIAWRGWAVAIQAKLRQATPAEIASWEASGSTMNLSELFSERPSASLKEKVVKLEQEKTAEHLALIKKMRPELVDAAEGRQDELMEVLKNMIEQGITYIFDYELKDK